MDLLYPLFFVLIRLFFLETRLCTTTVNSITLSGSTSKSFLSGQEGDSKFMWNPARSSWQEYIREFCGSSCSDTGKDKEFREICPSLECYPCDCSESCHFYGTCCITPSKNWTSSTALDNTDLAGEKYSPFVGTFSCLLPPSPKHKDKKRYLMVTQCPSSWEDDIIRRRCEDPSGFSLDDVTPLTVNSSGLTFSNLHCAICHGYSTGLPNGQRPPLDNSRLARPWTLRIICQHFQFFFHLADSYLFYRLTSSYPSDFCQVVYLKPQDGSFLRECQKWGDEKYRVDRCTLDIPHVTRLCHDLEPRLGYEVIGYKNVFCALCNGVHPSETYCPIPYPEGLDNPEAALGSSVPPVYLLFGSALGSVMDVNLQGLMECAQTGRWLDDEVRGLVESGQCLKTVQGDDFFELCL